MRDCDRDASRWRCATEIEMEVEIAGEKYAAQASLKPAYDPSGKNMRQ